MTEGGRKELVGGFTHPPKPRDATVCDAVAMLSRCRWVRQNDVCSLVVRRNVNSLRTCMTRVNVSFTPTNFATGSGGFVGGDCCMNYQNGSFSTRLSLELRCRSYSDDCVIPLYCSQLKLTSTPLHIRTSSITKRCLLSRIYTALFCSYLITSFLK